MVPLKLREIDPEMQVCTILDGLGEHTYTKRHVYVCIGYIPRFITIYLYMYRGPIE